MKKVIALLLLCSIAQLQGFTITNNADTTIKIGVKDGGSSRYYILNPQQSTANIIISSKGPVTMLTAHKFLDFSFQNDWTEFQSLIQKTCRNLLIECVGDRHGVLLEHLKTEKTKSLINKDAVTLKKKNNIYFFN